MSSFIILILLYSDDSMAKGPTETEHLDEGEVLGKLRILCITPI